MNPELIQASANELSQLIERAARGRGFDHATGQWLSVRTLTLIPQQPALGWAVKSLAAAPEPLHLERSTRGWRCFNRAILIAGPMLQDLKRAGERIDWEGFSDIDVPELWLDLPDSLPPILGPFAVFQEHWDALTDLAIKTYVPATIESRQRGAG